MSKKPPSVSINVKPSQERRSNSFDQPLHAAIARMTGGMSPVALSQAYLDWAQHLLMSPDKQIELIDKATQKRLRFLEYCPRACGDPHCSVCIEPLPQDKRFAGEAWQAWPYNAIYQGFLLTQQWWHNATNDVPGVTPHHQDIVSFAARQWLDMVSPANFLLANPEVLKTTFDEAGHNLLRGMSNFLEDWQRLQRGEKPVGTEAFEVGCKLAVTPGKVIFRNDLIELIQYEPATKQVYPEPVLLIPAWIMKYYILDLSPENSLVKHLVGKGHTVFAISWKNPTEEDRALAMDDYLQIGIMAALDAVSTIVPQHKVHAVGYCLGGTLLAIAAAAMARDGDDRLKTITMLAAQADFTEAGELMLFVDESQVSFLEAMMAQQGNLDTKQMAAAFHLLRSKDLVWSTMVRTYLMGRRQPMFDLMAWNSDGTRLPCNMHSEYLRQLFLNNDLAEERYKVGDRPVSLRDIRKPVFAVSTLSDHVAPWRSVYKLHALTNADVTFVLSNGGHNAGIVNPPGSSKRHHQIATHDDLDIYVDPDAWQKQAVNHEGSWWPCWQGWLKNHSGKLRKPPKLGAPKKGFRPLCDAPGTFVLEP